MNTAIALKTFIMTLHLLNTTHRMNEISPVACLHAPISSKTIHLFYYSHLPSMKCHIPIPYFHQKINSLHLFVTNSHIANSNLQICSGKHHINPKVYARHLQIEFHSVNSRCSSLPFYIFLIKNALSIQSNKK